MPAPYYGFIFSLLACISLKGLQATYYPDGYKGCFLDKEDRILEMMFPDSASNSGDFCKGLCREFRFRYAGTENGKECFCGDNIKDYEMKPDSECNTKCAGNVEEYCGGAWRISVYDNMGTTTIQTLTNSTTTLTTITTSGARNTKFNGISHHLQLILLPIVMTTALQCC
ncbi:xylosyltransferase oxt-like [Mercenaria mercenaria]|uniref:xylosyltransferase oxt-like n=1 Tax=Mercenaria mercenaria TaxID=6596 RepID=UPI001E1D4DFF|nr:xylosyltransferase oxt-like [Mercenaria mercenaria]XP_053397620.1 xylosyltransferase oxt-like [Mercenaria mercenaria]XP_053397621.1 xylosyltransferase oxt-like [Mercenaria mercenaria]